MSHDLDESTGKPAMAYVGERPWHGLGEALPPDQDIETWVQAARLDWEIEMLPVNYQMGGRTGPAHRRASRPWQSLQA